MKGLKIVAFVVVGIVVLLALGLVVALTPAVQTWAVHKAVAGQPGLTLEVGRVSAGFSAADLSDVRLVKDGIVVTAKSVSARYSAWDYLSRKKINVDAASVQDLVVDLRNATPAEPATTGAPATGGGKAPAPSPQKKASPAPAGKSAPFEGLLKEAQLPFDVRLAHLDAKGRALLPAEQSVAFDLKGDTIETGQRGTLAWTVDFADAKADAPLRTLRSTGTARLHLTNDRRIDTIEVDTIAAASGPKLPSDRVQLTAKAEQPAAGGNEGYSATVALLRSAAPEPLVKVNANYAVATREISGAWEIAVRTEQLAALLTGLGLPQVAANGAGKFTLKPDTRAVAASGDLQAQASQLQKLSPALEAVGAMQFKVTFDGGLADDVARLEKLDLEVTGGDGRKFAQISSLQKVSYNLASQKITLADPKTEVARIAVQQLPLAWAQPVAKPLTIESGDLSLVLAVEAEPDGSRIRARAVEPLALRAVTVRDAARKPLVEQVSLSVKPSVDYSAEKIVAQLAELRVSLPAGDAIAGNVSADVTNLPKAPVVAFAAQLDAKVVGALKPYLPVETGPLAAKIALEGRHEGQTLNLAKASVTVNRDNGALLTSIDLLQSVRADLAKSTFAVAKPGETAARVRLGEVPLAWAEAFVPKSKISGTLAGGTLEFLLRSIDDVTLNTTEPIALRGITTAMDGKALAQAVDVTANFSATKHGDAIAYEVRKIEVKQPGATLATIVVSGQATLGAKLVAAAKGSLDADIAALMKQPALVPYATLARGRVSATFDGSLGDAIQAKAAIAAKDLVAKQDNRALGDLDLNLTTTVKPDGSGSVSMPLTLTNSARKSDLKIDATFGQASDKKTFLFAGKIASSNLVVDDFQPLSGLAPASPESPKPATPAPAPRPQPGTRGVATTPPAKRDTEPFWKGANGKLEVDLKRILYGKDYTITNVRGTSVITDTKLSLDGLEGRFKENPFKLAGGLTFAASQPQPYALTASADVQNLDVGEILRAGNPNEKPALETKATLSAKLNGNGATLGDLGQNAYGKFELTGTQGTFRYLARKGSAGAAVNIASIGLSILGAARGSDTTMAIGELARVLNEVPFDSVKLQVERAQDLTFKLTSMELLSPILRLTGNGSVAAKNPEDIKNAPMNVQLQLGAKGELGYLLQRVGMLGGNKDAKGYQLMSNSFTIGGTPANPDNSELWKILGQAALGALVR